MYEYQRIVLLKSLRETLTTDEVSRKQKRINRRLIKRLEKGADIFEILRQIEVSKEEEI